MPVKRGRAGVEQEMEKFRRGELHTGSKTGPIVTNPEQAAAIAYRQAGMPRRTRKLRGR